MINQKLNNLLYFKNINSLKNNLNKLINLVMDVLILKNEVKFFHFERKNVKAFFYITLN